MKLKKNSLITKIWIYLIIFSITILAILWLFQVCFFDSYYEHVKTKDMDEIAVKISQNYKNEHFDDILDDISFNRGVCIEILSNDNSIYTHNDLSKGCIKDNDNPVILNYKKNFIRSNKESVSYKVTNPKFKNKILFYAMKLDNNNYLFINTSIEPLGWATNILQSQLVYITLIVLILSFVIAYFISKKISNPIIKINNAARVMAKGEYDVVFDTKETIAELNELSSTLENTCNELAKTDELRKELLANVSHDLKTPLTMIKAYAEMIRDITYKNKVKRNENLNIIIDEVDRLTYLVNDILDFSKMQSEVINLNYTEFDLNLVIKNVINKFKSLNKYDCYNFIYTGKNKIIIEADKKRIEQVIYNLLSNAINYSDSKKEIKINIIEENDKYKIEIINWSFIKKEELKFIWDKYYRTDKNHKRNIIGTGLGLSIVKSILELHKFNYGVTSSKKDGTNFYFEIKKK